MNIKWAIYFKHNFITDSFTISNKRYGIYFETHESEDDWENTINVAHRLHIFGLNIVCYYSKPIKFEVDYDYR